MNKKDLNKYQKILDEQLKMLVQDLQNLEDSILRRSGSYSAGDLTNIPTHIADISSETVAQNLAIDLIQNEEGVATMIQEALQRIKEKTYGICENCSKPIGLKRLSHIPYAKLCIRCKTEAEKQQTYRR